MVSTQISSKHSKTMISFSIPYIFWNCILINNQWCQYVIVFIGRGLLSLQIFISINSFLCPFSLQKMICSKVRSFLKTPKDQFLDRFRSLWVKNSQSIYDHWEISNPSQLFSLSNHFHFHQVKVRYFYNIYRFAKSYYLSLFCHGRIVDFATKGGLLNQNLYIVPTYFLSDRKPYRDLYFSINS